MELVTNLLLQKSRRLGADFDNKKKEKKKKGERKRKEKSRINDFCCTRDPNREIACKLDGAKVFQEKESHVESNVCTYERKPRNISDNAYSPVVNVPLTLI